MSSPERLAWYNMNYRCSNPKTVGWHHYGGRGITVCQRWVKSFDNFLKDMGPRPSPEHSIDRYPDKDGHYEPNNCRWATRAEQAANKNKRTPAKGSPRIKRLEFTHHDIVRAIRGAYAAGITNPTVEISLSSGTTLIVGGANGTLCTRLSRSEFTEGSANDRANAEKRDHTPCCWSQRRQHRNAPAAGCRQICPRPHRQDPIPGARCEVRQGRPSDPWRARFQNQRKRAALHQLRRGVDMDIKPKAGRRNYAKAPVQHLALGRVDPRRPGVPCRPADGRGRHP